MAAVIPRVRLRYVSANCIIHSPAGHEQNLLGGVGDGRDGAGSKDRQRHRFGQQPILVPPGLYGLPEQQAADRCDVMMQALEPFPARRMGTRWYGVPVNQQFDNDVSSLKLIGSIQRPAWPVNRASTGCGGIEIRPPSRMQPPQVCLDRPGSSAHCIAQPLACQADSSAAASRSCCEE